MSIRTDTLIQILDKIGGPLMDAVAAHGQAAEADLQKDAQDVAALLAKVVEMSISMNQMLDLKPEEAGDDALRAALAGLAGPMVAGQYAQKKGQVPNENDLKRLQSSMQAVLTFADNFAPSADAQSRLQGVSANAMPADGHQINIQYVHAFLPVIDAIGTFSFGQPEQKLMMDTSERLVKRAVEMRETLFPSVAGDDQKLCELSLLRALSGIYASCHKAQTETLAGADQAPGASSIEDVWNVFETRAAMLEAAVRNILPESVVPASVAAAPVSPPVSPPVTPPAEAPPQAPVQPSPAQTPPAQDTTQGTQDSAGGASPMGFFAAPGASSETPPETPAAPPPVQPPAQPPADNTSQDSGGANPMGFFAAPGASSETPPETPPPAAPVQPPPQPPAEPPAAQPPPTQPPQQPPSQTPAQPATPPPQDGQGGDSGGGPMSFFTKKEDED